ncbi:hypothetical protein [Paraburkholderia diazotrophica]|uniref:hypothetical protein n=1 Tax=Paraburkholderia diazotrophica TaxID=667676 RepID=UPI00115FB51F|nr:hypothetical protein [Paraburkholderia diazotrophica]
MPRSPQLAYQPRIEPLDALAAAFVELARYDNTNTNQIVIVQGVVDAGRLASAVVRAASAFPLLLSRISPRVREPDIASIVVAVRHCEGECDFSDDSFRRLLMSLNQHHRLDWRRRLPFQVYLVLDAGRRKSCVYVSSAHAVADARSDCLLLERIMWEYRHCEIDRARASGGGRIHPHASLRQIRPQWYGLIARVARLAHAGAAIAADVARRDYGMPCKRDGRVPSDDIDFYHSLMDEGLAQTVGQMARRAGVTLNTVLSAALARLLERLNDARRPVRLTCAVSLRFTLGREYVDTFRNYLVATALRVPAGLDACGLIAYIDRSMREARRSPGLLRELGRLEWLTVMLKVPMLYPLTRAVVRRVQGTNACFSNPGLIAEDLSTFGVSSTGDDRPHDVLHYTGFGCLVEPYDFILYTPTINGRLQLDAVYRRAAFGDVRTQLIERYCDELRLLASELDGRLPARALDAVPPETGVSA